MAEHSQILERAATPGGELVLRRRGADFEIISNGTFLMDTRDGRSERLLVNAALDRCASPRPRVLIGGLGVGFSLTAAVCRAEASVIDVAEISAEIIRWHGSHLRHLTASARADPRVRVIHADVAEWLASGAGRYDAICLDVDNGPHWLSREANLPLYRDAGLRGLREALSPGGVLTVWSAAAVPDFGLLLGRHFTGVRALRVPVRRGEPDVVYVAVASM